MDVVAEPIALTKTSLLEIEREKLNLERYKAQLDYKKFVLGSVFVALAIAAIPPLFQLATAVLEYTKSNADRQAKQQAFRDDYIKEFVSNALNQDIELRIRICAVLLPCFDGAVSAGLGDVPRRSPQDSQRHSRPD